VGKVRYFNMRSKCSSLYELNIRGHDFCSCNSKASQYRNYFVRCKLFPFLDMTVPNTITLLPHKLKLHFDVIVP